MAFLRELVKEKVDFMIVGLSAAALQGAPAVTQNIELWLKDYSDSGVAKALSKVGGSCVPAEGKKPPIFVGEAVKLFDIVTYVRGLGEFEEEREHTVKIPLGRIKVDVMKLDRVIESKKASGRHKDMVVIPVLTDALITIKQSSKRPGYQTY